MKDNNILLNYFYTLRNFSFKTHFLREPIINTVNLDPKTNFMVSMALNLNNNVEIAHKPTG